MASPPRRPFPARPRPALGVAVVLGLVLTLVGTTDIGSSSATPARTVPSAGPALAPFPAAAKVARRAVAQQPRSSLQVLSVNLREGGLVRSAADQRDRRDVRAFARRALTRSGGVPDVVLAQEVLGSAPAVTRALNAQPRARAAGASYRAVTTTGRSVGAGACQGSRAGRFSLLRGAAVIVNTRTVPRVLARGEIRTWGRWGGDGQAVTGRDGYGCSAQPWVRLRVDQPAAAPATALVSSVHIAPSHLGLKNRAVTHVRRQLDARRAPGDLVVLGGDLNLNRCSHALSRAEPRRCQVRLAHRQLAAAGYRDAVRSRLPAGPGGVVGVARRIDFLYTPSRVVDAWHDRCYLAFHVRRPACGARRSVFAKPAPFHRCQTRTLRFGRPGPSCPPARYDRYYSDHKMLWVTVR